MAAQRRGPTCSRNSGTDSAVMSNGATKKMAYALLNGRVCTAYTNDASIPMPIAPRSRCSGQRTRSSGRAPTVSSAQASNSGNDAAPRSAATCSGE